MKEVILKYDEASSVIYDQNGIITTWAGLKPFDKENKISTEDLIKLKEAGFSCEDIIELNKKGCI